MRSPFIATAIIIVAIFSGGYVVGAVSGALPTFAADATTTPTPAAPGSAAPGGFHGAPHADGTVTAVNGDTITVKADNDPAGSTEYTKVTTITVNGSTQYYSGFMPATKASITVGSHIIAEGTVSSDGTTLTATRIGLGGLGGAGHFGHMGGFGPHADGSVVTVSGNTVTVKPGMDRSGMVEQSAVTTIELTGNTTYDAGPSGPANKDSIKAGTFVIATGTLSSDGKTLTAAHVTVLSSAPMHAHTHGWFR